MTSANFQQIAPLSKPRIRPAVFWAVYAAVAFYAIFRVPFRFPPSEPLVSASYSFGFSNQVAILAIMVLIGIAALYRISEPNSVGLLQFSPGGESRVSLVLVTSAILAYLILTMAIYLWARSMDWYGIDWETSHFLWRLRLSEIYGLQPYRDFQ